MLGKISVGQGPFFSALLRIGEQIKIAFCSINEQITSDGGRDGEHV